MVAPLFERLDAQRLYQKEQAEVKALVKNAMPRAERIVREYGTSIPYHPSIWGSKEDREIFEYTTDIEHEGRTIPFRMQFEQTASGSKSLVMQVVKLEERLSIGGDGKGGFSPWIGRSNGLEGKTRDPFPHVLRATLNEIDPYIAAIDQIHAELFPQSS